jgi:hypothetical protein
LLKEALTIPCLRGVELRGIIGRKTATREIMK